VVLGRGKVVVKRNLAISNASKKIIKRNHKIHQDKMINSSRENKNLSRQIFGFLIAVKSSR